LLNYGAYQVVTGLNDRLTTVRQVLPSAAKVLDAALAEAHGAQ
jgi:hypothetical protein